jgi:hypothetical protein
MEGRLKSRQDTGELFFSLLLCARLRNQGQLGGMFRGRNVARTLCPAAVPATGVTRGLHRHLLRARSPLTERPNAIRAVAVRNEWCGGEKRRGEERRRRGRRRSCFRRRQRSAVSPAPVIRSGSAVRGRRRVPDRFPLA